MANVKDLIGVQYEPYTMEIEKGKVREFAEAIGEDNPIYYDLESAKKEGFKGIPIPLTFLTSVDFWAGPSFEEKVKKLQINPVKVLHGEQEYEFIGDIYVGDVLSVESKVVDVVVKQGSSGGMNLITTENKYFNLNGELVAKSKGVTIERH
ncbi:FAS1-like dehydratase domain-containing protein [Oceanobacillus senegalensis]|uniref:FAS1-like dehydratase domain-containing protein n=1 Tax=Oceanobacillus senegalensis TaxID=1936063 RepID=UPI000A312620|nr:MaoC family dehydratase N-terminal domain-containing protein [Oceanobacillus senegalensis]